MKNGRYIYNTLFHDIKIILFFKRFLLILSKLQMKNIFKYMFIKYLKSYNL